MNSTMRACIGFSVGVAIIIASQLGMYWLSIHPAGALRFWHAGVYRCLELKVEPLVTSGGGVAFHDGERVREAAGQWDWKPGGKCDAE